MATLQIDLHDVVNNRRLWVSLRDNLPVRDLIQKLVSDLELPQGEYQLAHGESKKMLPLDATLKEQNIQNEQKLRIQKKKKGPAVVPIPIAQPSKVSADSKETTTDMETPADADVESKAGSESTRKLPPKGKSSETRMPPPPPPPHHARPGKPDGFWHRPLSQPRFLNWIPSSLWFYMRPMIIFTILLIMILCYLMGLCVCRNQKTNQPIIANNPTPILIPTNTPQPTLPTAIALPDTETLISELPKAELPYHGTCFVIFNTEKEPFDDVTVRRAFSQAVDRDYLTENAVCECGFTERETATTLFPRRLYTQLSGADLYSQWFDSDFYRLSGPDFYVKWVNSLIENSYAPEEINIEFATSEGFDPIAETIKKEWVSNLGVDVTTTISEYETFVELVTSDQAPQAYLSCNYSDIASPMDFLYAFISGYYGEYIHWNAPNEYYQILLEAYDNGDASLYMEAERMLVEEYAVIMPIYHYIQQ